MTTPSFCITNSTGTVVAKIGASGNLRCAGIYQNRNTLNVPNDGCWVVVDANDDEQLYVNSSGYLYTRGSVNTNALQ